MSQESQFVQAEQVESQAALAGAIPSDVPGAECQDERHDWPPPCKQERPRSFRCRSLFRSLLG